MENHTTIIALLIFAYLSGSIPFGLLLTRAFGLGDIRTIGSGNIGATNVLRTGNKKLAAATLVCDALKAATAVYLAKILAPNQDHIHILCGLFAFLGHLFPIWLKFKGGKGVACFIGILLALSPLSALFFCLIWLGVAFISKYSSLAALAASALTPLYFFKTSQDIYLLGALAMAFLLFLMHHQNIKRLLKGEESKIGASKK